jgi:spore coat polysaccharide biosynthesis protein SpsF
MAAGQQNNNTVAIIQARLKSTRLPGKILMPMPVTGEVTIIERIVKSLKKSQLINEIYIATSVNPENDSLEELCQKNAIKSYRGSEEDVLSRFVNILDHKKYKTAVRLTADNPVLDYNILDKVIIKHHKTGADYTKTKGLPLGMNFEVFEADSLLKFKAMDLSEDEKEHVTVKFRNDNSFDTNIINLNQKLSDVRLTIDYPEDYLVVSTLFQLAEKFDKEINLEFINFVNHHYPWLLKINKKSTQKGVYNSLEEEIIDVIPILSNLDFKRTVYHLENFVKSN